VRIWLLLRRIMKKSALILTATVMRRKVEEY
jgi:hypothetical protein